MNKIKTISIAFITALIALTLGVLWSQQQAAPVEDKQPGKKVTVLTTFFPLYDFTRNVGKDRIELAILFTQTPEVSSLRSEDVQKINQADLLVKNGVGLEPVIDDLVKSSDNKNITVVDTSQGVSIAAGDPHIWLDPQNAIIQVQNIRDGLIGGDPANAAFYQQNAETYIQQLRQLDQAMRAGLTPLPKKDFVAFHSAFGYFAKRYGLNQAATIEEFPGKEPSPQYLAEVIATIKRLRSGAIFSEPQFSPKVVETIAHDLGLPVRVLDPVETGDPNRDSYISIMRKNLQTLEEAFR